MKVSLSDISNLYQGYLRNTRSAASGLCPDPERLVRSVMTDVPASEKAEITRHAANCSACAEVVKGLLRVSSDIDKLAEHVAEQAAILSRSDREHGSSDIKTVGLWSLKKPLAAILVGLAAVAIVALSIFRTRDESSTRGGQPKRIQAVYPIKVSVPKSGIQFRWEALADASYYRIDLFDKSFALVWRSARVRGNSIQVSVTDDMKVFPGETYYWIVTAFLNDQTEVESKLVEFSIKR